MRAVLDYLCERTEFASWLLVRTRAADAVVLSANDSRFATTAQQLIAADPSSDERFGGASMAIAPVCLPNGTAFGSLVGIAEGPLVRQSEHLGKLIDLLADTLGAIIGGQIDLAAQQRLNERVTAQIDALTGLATRPSWFARLRSEELRCHRLGEPAAVIIIDLDDLKRQNELHGHDVGDAQLKAAAAVVRDVLGNRHFVARTTGDQFGVAIAALDLDGVRAVESSLRHALSAAGISAAIGVGVREPGGSMEAALADAEAALVATHTVQVAASSRPSPAASSHLVEALERGAIRAYFQPIVDLRTGEVVAIEALARWQADDGVREPEGFLHLLQEAGLLGALFERILDDGLEHLAEFRHISPTLRLAVNFEFDSIPEEGLLNCVTKALAKHELPGDSLSLELSERQTFDLSAAIKAELVAVADLGVKLMLDDFGTGYASLETLTSLPVSGVKLDRRFTGQVVSGDREPAVVKAMISMAAEAGMLVIAEGIETQTQCDRLIRLGCRLGQGYLFALPQPPDSLTAVLSAPLVSTF